MVIDFILDVCETRGGDYDAKTFYNDIAQYGDIAFGICSALDSGTNWDVANKIKEYMVDNLYSVSDANRYFINHFDWIQEFKVQLHFLNADDFTYTKYNTFVDHFTDNDGYVTKKDSYDNLVLDIDYYRFNKSELNKVLKRVTVSNPNGLFIYVDTEFSNDNIKSLLLSAEDNYVLKMLDNEINSLEQRRKILKEENND